MSPIRPIALPQEALLQRYRQDGAYTDCYRMDMAHVVPLADYVAAFYTTRLFRIERCILALLARRPSSDAGAANLASGRASSFAAWSVEGRTQNQLLLRDFLGRTRSWLMVVPTDTGGTSLYFGSAVTPVSMSAEGVPSFGFAFRALHGFHHLYTKALMGAAQSKLALAGS